METAPCPELAQWVHSLGRPGRPDWIVTSLASGLPEATGKNLQPAPGSFLSATVQDL